MRERASVINSTHSTSIIPDVQSACSVQFCRDGGVSVCRDLTNEASSGCAGNRKIFAFVRSGFLVFGFFVHKKEQLALPSGTTRTNNCAFIGVNDSRAGRSPMKTQQFLNV